MKFGMQDLDCCEGTILAHSLSVRNRRLKKGQILSDIDIYDLKQTGFTEITVAQLEASDVGENEAAECIARAIVASDTNLRATVPFTGRVNIYSEIRGLIEIDCERVINLNLVDPSITLATLQNKTQVTPGLMIATLKIITYGVNKSAVAKAIIAAKKVLRLHKVVKKSAGLILTQHESEKSKLIDKSIKAVSTRLEALGIELIDTKTVNHDVRSIKKSIEEIEGDLILLLTASATSDQEDVGPMALNLAGGKVFGFGIPVDPGNLLFHGKLKDRNVIGLPGCARSIAQNGADWMLEQIACGIPPTQNDIAAWGVGGLLKEIPTRPHPRERQSRQS